MQHFKFVTDTSGDFTDGSLKYVKTSVHEYIIKCP